MNGFHIDFCQVLSPDDVFRHCIHPVTCLPSAKALFIPLSGNRPGLRNMGTDVTSWPYHIKIPRLNKRLHATCPRQLLHSSELPFACGGVFYTHTAIITPYKTILYYNNFNTAHCMRTGIFGYSKHSCFHTHHLESIFPGTGSHHRSYLSYNVIPF